MQKVLITGVLPAEVKHGLEKLGLSITAHGARDLIDQSTFAETIKEFDFYISGGDEKMTAQVLAAANSLKLIAFLGVDCNAYIDVQAATAKGVKVCNTPGANAISVSEFAVGLMIDAQRRIAASAHSLMQGEAKCSTRHVVAGKTVGLIGMGPIGLRMAEICSKGLRADVVYWSRSGEKQAAKELGAKFVQLDDLVAVSDIISIQAPAAAGCLLDGKRMQKLKPGCTIVNISTAELCEPKALLDAMKKDPELYAAFDGFYDEKENPAIKELQQLGPSRILITPHVAWRTFEADQACYSMAIKSLSEFLQGISPSNLVA